MKFNKLNITLVASILLFLSGCAAILGNTLPSVVKSSSARSVHMAYGDEVGAKEKATKECQKWGKTEAVLTQRIPGEVPNYYYDCK
jgi:hypothetical protein